MRYVSSDGDADFDPKEITYHLCWKFVHYFCERAPEVRNQVEPWLTVGDGTGIETDNSDIWRRQAEYPNEIAQIARHLRTEQPFFEGLKREDVPERLEQRIRELQSALRPYSRKPSRPDWRVAFRVLAIEAFRLIAGLSASKAVAEFNRMSDFSKYQGEWREIDKDGSSNAKRNYYRDREKVREYLHRLGIREDTLLNVPQPYWPKRRPTLT